MARKIVDIGVAGNDGTGDSIREAFRKTNENFQELYAVFGQGGFLKFTDLSDTPTTLVGESNKVPVVNSSGTSLEFRRFTSPSDTIGITYTASEIRIDTKSTRLFDDPLPRLKYGMNASNQVIGGVRAPTNNVDFEDAVDDFNTNHGTAYSINSFVINKGYADNKYVNVAGDIMTGPLSVPPGASGSQVPRASETLLRTGGTLTGPLFLEDHPGALAGSGTPNSFDDLQAATKYYVDNASYTSQVNLFVSTQGDDQQSQTPLGKEGRSWAYAYRTLNRACQKAEELMNNAPDETGPYRQLIAYGGGETYSEVTYTTTGASGTTRVFFTNNGGGRVDQGALPRPDIVSGKLVVGRTSGASGIIYTYYGADGSSAIGEDYFDLQDVVGEFVAGENLEFDQPVKRLQITVFIESGTYEEDYPIRIPQNVSIIGEELRRVIIRPADRPSRSPWADIWFRRDKSFDGLTLTSTEFGYHYLTDPSDVLSEPKNNRDMDVFLCNDAIIIRQISCQGHGGFMMVLDPEGQVLSKSPYIQQSGSFSQSLNKQAFRGGQYVDGFAGNVPLLINSKTNTTELLVTGSERAPVTPCSFIIDGRTFKIDAFTDDGTGYGGARELIRKNKEFIKAEVIGYINTELNPEFTYSREVCQRDIGLIIDSVGYDLVLGTNFNSVKAGQAYYRGNQYDTLPSALEQTLAAIQFVKDRVAVTVSSNLTAVDRTNAGINEIVDIITNGVSASDEIVFPNPSGLSVGLSNTKDLILDNIEFIKAEVIAYINQTFPLLSYDPDKCARDTEYMVNAAIYDLIYGGNSATVDAGLQYYNKNGVLQIIGQTVETTSAINYIKEIVASIVVNETVTPYQSDEVQIKDLLNPGSLSAANTLTGYFNTINSIILGGPSVVGNTVTIVYPTLAGIDAGLIDSRNLLLTAKISIQSDTTTYLDQTYAYNQNTCARDTGYIVDAIAHDVFYGGNLKTVQASLSYFNASASSKIVIDRQLSNTLAAIAHINTVIQSVINNVSPTRYQFEVVQFFNPSISDGNTASPKINQLFAEMLSVLDSPPDARDARELLVKNKEFVKAEVINFINNTYSSSITATNSATDRITGNTTNLRVGMPVIFGSSNSGGLPGVKNISGASIPSAATYTNVPVSTITGSGAGAQVTVVKTGGGSAYTLSNTIVTVITAGSGYNENDSLIVLGSNLGGADGVNDLKFKVGSFAEELIGGILSATPYYIKDIISPTQFTISFIPNGPVVPLENDIGDIPVRLNYNSEICSRDVGFIIANVSSDLLYGGTYNTIKSARRYHIGTTSSRVVINEQLPETLAALDYAKQVAVNVLTQTAPTVSYQALNNIPVDNRVAQYTNNELVGTPYASTLSSLMDLLEGLIENPDLNITSIIPTAKPIVYPIYRLILSDTTPFANELEYTVSGFVSKALSNIGDGSWDVVVNIPIQSVAPLADTRYSIRGNSNFNYNNDVVECVSSTISSMTFRYQNDPGVWGTGLTTITYVESFMTLAAGNTSMCSNDFTQINDMGYGLIATNIGLIEAVSVFSYYCWTAYFANNGGQIRSLNGSNAHGEYGIVSSGSDPLEIPDTQFLSDNMMQVARVYKLGNYANDGAKGDLEVYTYYHSYSPYNISEVEINHGSGLIGLFDKDILVGGSGYTPASGTVTYANIPLVNITSNGINATADFTITNGTIVLVNIRNQGFRYSVGDLLSVDPANVGGTGSGCVITVLEVEGNGIGRYEISGVSDVSSTVPVTVTSASVSGSGPYLVTFNFAPLPYIPKTGVPYTVSSSAVLGFNAVRDCVSSTSSSVTLSYPTDPGNPAAIGLATKLWGRGNIIRLNLNTSGNEDTSTTGLSVALEHNQKIIIRSNQNFKYYEVNDTNPVRPSTALTFVNDPNGANEDALVYRVLSYGTKGPLNEDLAPREAILGFDTTYDYIKLLVSAVNAGNSDPDNPGKTLGATAGDLAIAVEQVNELSIENRLNSADMIIAWDGKVHRVLSYENVGTTFGYGIVRFEDIAGQDVNISPIVGLNSSVSTLTNLDLGTSPTIRAGLAATEKAEVVVRISTCRVTGHDFLEIGTGSYNQTNYPNKIYGAPREPNQAREVQERTKGRCFYVTTDQDGIFRVGRFFTVDQGTGSVTFAASIALSNLDGLGFKRGVTVSEFSNDDKFTDGANDAVPTESAVQGYINRRLGLDKNSTIVDESELIGPGYMDRGGKLEATADLSFGSYRLLNVGAPASGSDAANKQYVDSQELSDVRVDTSTTPARATNDLLVYNGTKWVNAQTVTTGDIQTSLSGKSLALNIKDGAIINTDVNDNAAIAQSKLNMTAASTRANAVDIAQVDLGLASFKASEFTATNGWIELQTSSSATTGVTLNKIQRIGNNSILGNLSGAAGSVAELTPGNVVSAGDGIKNASFTSSGAMTVTAGSPNEYSVTPITTNGGANSLVKTDANGIIDVKAVKVDGVLVLDTATTTLNITTPGGVTFLASTGSTAANTESEIVGLLSVSEFSTGGNTTLNPSNANVSISPSGTGTVTINPAVAGTINRMNIGATTRGTGAFTTLAANGAVSFTANLPATAINNGTGTLQVTGGAAISGTVYAGTFNGPLTGAVTGNVTGNLTGNVTGNLTGNVTGNITGSVTGNADTATKVVATATGTNSAELVRGNMADNDMARILVGATATNSGYLEIATADDGTEPIYVRQYSGVFTTLTRTATLLDGSGNTSFPGTVTATTFIGNLSGNASSANYADLAEKYLADSLYEPGTVLVFGGDNEVTTTNIFGDRRVAGVVSTNPGYLMNSELTGDFVTDLALTGRVPCKVIGKVKKGDLLVSAAKAGYAIVNNDPANGTIIGKALENKDSLGEGIVEVVVGRF